MDNVLCWFGNGCILSMLEPHLAEIGADAGTVSITFLLFGLVFAVSTPITGIVSFKLILAIKNSRSRRTKLQRKQGPDLIDLRRLLEG